MATNDAAAASNQQLLDAAGVLGVNVMAAPGAGKTSLIVQTLRGLQGRPVTFVVAVHTDVHKLRSGSRS